jgi:DNA invertase Pin-like site-specific DNA recombinase
MANSDRGYSTAFVRRVKAAKRYQLRDVQRLAQTCIDSEVPIAVVAELFGVTRATVYNWLVAETEPRRLQYSAIPEVLAKLTKLK